MAVADLIITKPGGLTTSEALALGKPLFILNPIPGQEAANSDFLLEHGAAAKVNRVEDLPFRIEQLLGSKKLAEMAKAAKVPGPAAIGNRRVPGSLETAGLIPSWRRFQVSSSSVAGLPSSLYWLISAMRVEGDRRKAKPVVRPGASNSAGIAVIF